MSTSDSREESPASSPTNINHAPKYGTLVPNRVFVGGIGLHTTESELQALFSKYGNVKATKIISDRAGVSKGYGFVTFSSETEAKKIQDEANNIYLKDRKLNIAPAIKKQPFNRAIDGSGPQVSSVMCQNGVPYTFHNGTAFFTQAVDPSYNSCSPQQGTAVQVVYPQPYFVPQQYPQPPNIAPQPVATSQWTRWPSQTYCSYPHQYMSYNHPNAVIPSTTPPTSSSTDQTSMLGCSPSTRQTNKQNPTIKQAQTSIPSNLNGQSPMQQSYTGSPQIIPSPEAMNSSMATGMQVFDYKAAYNQAVFHNVPCFQSCTGTQPVMGDGVHNEPYMPENAQQYTPVRREKDSYSSMSQSSCSLSPSPRKFRPRMKADGSYFPKVSRSLVQKSVNGVQILAYPKNCKNEPLTPPPTPRTIASSALPFNASIDYSCKVRHNSL